MRVTNPITIRAEKFMRQCLSSLQQLGRVMKVSNDLDDEDIPANMSRSQGACPHTYIVEKTGARVMLTTSIAMLNNLCASIKGDRYGWAMMSEHVYVSNGVSLAC